jgi:transcriptional regulator with PAS, ATPase and Fis domain
LVGESGAGKEVIAEEIHRRSRRAKGPLLRLNCAALPPHLLESELFGYERGAFTGAVRGKPGLLESASGGSVLLDEIGELATEIQPKLLRALESREVLRVGGLKPIPIDVRFIAATHRDLELLVVLGTFRHDLLFRLNGITIHVPPLRERTSEIESLSAVLLAEASARAGKPVLSLEDDATELLASYRWPVNVRELRNVLERGVLLCDGDRIRSDHVVFGKTGAPAERPAARASIAPPTPPSPLAVEPSGEGDERERIVAALASCGGNQTEAAKMLGLSRRMLGYRLDKLGVRRPRKG